MSASSNIKKACIKCNKGGGILICDGCQQSFCGKHVVEHRQELTNRLDEIMQEYDVIQQELGQLSNERILLEDINKWEKDSIAKIRAAAEAARENLRQALVESKERLSRTCRDIARELRSSRENDDFSENDLTRWTEQIEELQLDITSPSSLKLCEDKSSVIPLITVQYTDIIKKQSTKVSQISAVENVSTLTLHDTFWKVLGHANIDENGFRVTHVGNDWRTAHILGQQLYSQGQHVIRFEMEQVTNSSLIYFGCISSQATDDQIGYRSLLAAGWSGNKTLYQHGSSFKDSNRWDGEVKTKDLLRLTFDCDNQQIELLHECINKTYQARVDANKSPFPWRFLVSLGNSNDCVRILPN